MRRYFNILIVVFIGMFLFNILDVKAAEFPISVESEGLSLSITGVDIKVYDYSNNKIEDYFEAYKTINVPADSLTISPNAKKVKYNYFPEMISVNLNLSHPSLDALLTAGAPIDDDSKVYKAILVVNYKINKIPKDYDKIRHYTLLGNTSKGLYSIKNPNSIDYTASQWISMGTYSKKDGAANLDNSLLSDESMKSSLWDFDLLLKSDADFGQEDVLNQKGLALFIHNFSNLDSVMGTMQSSWFNEKTDNNTNNNSNNNNSNVNTNTSVNDTPSTPAANGSQTIRKIPDTAASDRFRLLMGMSILLIGSSIVIFELRKKS